MSTLVLPYMLSERDALLFVVTESGCLHQSWEIEGGSVIVYEYIPENYPKTGLMSFKNIKEYVDSMKEVHWINDKDYVKKVSDQIKKEGFPFVEN